MLSDHSNQNCKSATNLLMGARNNQKARAKSAVRFPPPIAPSRNGLGNRINSACAGALPQTMRYSMKRSMSKYYTNEEPFCRENSPFRAADEEIFLQREKNKVNKDRIRSARFNQQVWEKTTATSKSGLTRIRTDDISPKKVDTNAVTYDLKQKNMINQALQVARSRVVLPTGPPKAGLKRRPASSAPGGGSKQDQQKMDEFINQKKEMFRVQLAYNTLQKEITTLEQQALRRKEALELSKDELEQDRKRVMNFVQKDNMNKKNKEAIEKRQIKLKQEKEDTVRRQDTHYQQLQSEIEKNLETIEQMDYFKDFFKGIAKPEDVENHERYKSQMMDAIKQKWIDNVMIDTSQDELIFHYTDIFPVDESTALSQQNSKDHMDILEACGIKLEVPTSSQQITNTKGAKTSHNNENVDANLGASHTSKNLQSQIGYAKNSSSGLPPVGPSGTSKKKKAVIVTRSQMRHQLKRSDWSLIFDEMMRRDLIDLPDEYYDEPQYFDEPDELTDQFTQIEQDNLFCILRSQEAQEQYEAENHCLGDRIRVLGGQRNDLKKDYNELTKKIDDSTEMFKQLQQSNIMSFMIQPPKEGEVPNTKVIKTIQLEPLIEDLRQRMCQEFGDKLVNVHNRKPEDILNDVEQKLHYQKELIEKHSESTELFKFSRKLKKDNIEANSIRIAEIQAREEEIIQAYQKARQQKVFKRIGKTVQTRSDKPIIKREVQKQEIDQDEQDMRSYVGDLQRMLELQEIENAIQAARN